MSKLEPGQARVEFLAVKDEAVRLLRQGHMYTKVYASLKEKQKITMSYPAFYHYASLEFRHPLKVKKAGSVKDSAVTPAEAEYPGDPARRGPVIIGDKTAKFGKERPAPPEALI